MRAMTSRENHCPQCGKLMHNGHWVSQRGHRYMAMAKCPEHGRYLIRHPPQRGAGWENAGEPPGLRRCLRRGPEV